MCTMMAGGSTPNWFLQVLAEKQEYLLCVKDAAPESFNKSSDTQRDALLAAITTSPCTVTTAVATQFIREVQVGPFADDAKKALVHAINAKIETTALVGPFSTPQKKSRAQLQNHMYMQNYLTEADWNDLQNPALDLNAKMRVLINRVALLGVKNPTESSMVSIVALLYLASAGTQHVHDPVATHSTLKDMKHMLKHWGHTACSLASFPQDPLEFKKAEIDVYTTAYASEEHVKSRVDDPSIERLRNRIPARISHSSFQVGGRFTSLGHAQARRGQDEALSMLSRIFMGMRSFLSCNYAVYIMSLSL